SVFRRFERDSLCLDGHACFYIAFLCVGLLLRNCKKVHQAHMGPFERSFFGGQRACLACRYLSMASFRSFCSEFVGLWHKIAESGRSFFPMAGIFCASLRMESPRLPTYGPI